MTNFNICYVVWYNSCSFEFMKDTYGRREYICDCGAFNEDYVWESELKAHVLMCGSCNEEVRYANLKAKKGQELVSIRTPTKNR